ncbi:hypothetical protein [Reinekea sp.]|jgi:hypothetical protein|uniref:hypothetical protein n=1 Tax=Reinekea sp. TaxID=1970455 RepID=UPI00398A208F
MSFSRTNSGISNSHLFYGVDLIVYTEGGKKSFSAEEALNGEANESSIDVKFWSGIFNSHGLNKIVKFRAVGSKTASSDICKKIESGEIHNVVVAKDRDLEFFQSTNIDSPYILYTKGYSWENDVFVEENTRNTIASLITVEEIPEQLDHDISVAFRDFKLIGKRLLRLELIFQSQGVKFITGVGGERFCNPKKTPRLDRGKLMQYIECKKTEITRPAFTHIITSEYCPLLCCYGKLIEDLSYNVITYVLKKISNHKSTPKSIVEMLMLDKYIQSVRDTNDEYYSNLVSRLNAVA